MKRPTFLTLINIYKLLSIFFADWYKSLTAWIDKSNCSFSLLDKFITYYNDGELENIEDIAKKVYYIIQNQEKFPINIISLRDVSIK